MNGKHHSVLASRPVWAAALLSGILCWSTAAYGQKTDHQRMFPFVLPWDDASPGPVNLSSWNEPIGSGAARVQVGPGGHFVVGDRRVRFLGVNLCFGACFPTKDASEKIAPRMAKFGINVVRFHHMDMRRFPHGILRRGSRSSRELDPEAVDRLDYLIHCLARSGIYTNLNLLVSRRFSRHDGLPEAIESLDWKDQHIIGFFDDRLFDLQKEYAGALLARRNRYRGRRYADDPAIAFVEINNENGLVHAWLGGRVDRIPEEFLGVLQAKWNRWLRTRYGTTAALATAWRVRHLPPGRTLVSPQDLGQPDRWVLERHERAVARLTRQHVTIQGTSMPAVQVTVLRPGTARWHVQLTRPGLAVQADRPYTVQFWARADRPRKVRVAVRQAHSPWAGLGFSAAVDLGTDWRLYRFTFALTRSDQNARLELSGLSQRGARFWFASVSLREGGTVGLPPGARVEDGSVPVITWQHRGTFTTEARADWLRFLWEVERDYWREMYRYLKEDLGVQALVTGTIIGCSTPFLQKHFDWIDTHAYWQHPVFPERPWDPEDWYVPNLSMVNDPNGGTLPRLALRRVVGKPHAVSEYNHPAPNTYSAEAFLLLAAYAALQDWDAIYGFNYSSRADDWDSRAIRGYFTIDQHPGKMVTFPVAAALFRRADVRPARQAVTVRLSAAQEQMLLREARPWQLVHAGLLGVPASTALRHRVGIQLADRTDEAAAEPTATTAHRVQSDTGQLIWDRRHKERGYVLVRTPRTKAAIGFIPDAVDLGGVRIASVRTLQDGWAVLALSALEGQLPDSGGSAPLRALLVAVGLVENTGMRWRVDPWRDPLRASLGRNWGGAPTRVEGVEAQLTVRVDGRRLRVYALDERGRPRANVPVRATAGTVTFAIGPTYRTLWYLLEAE